MHRSGTPDGSSGSLRQAQEPNLALLHELRHRADCLFNRCIGVHTVLVIEVDDIHTEASEARFAALPDVIGFPIDTKEAAVLAAHIAKFSCQNDLLAFAFDRSAYQLLIGAETVDVGCVEKIDAQLECPVNCRDGFLIIAAGIKVRHAHAAQAKGRNRKAIQFALLHSVIPLAVPRLAGSIGKHVLREPFTLLLRVWLEPSLLPQNPVSDHSLA